MYCSNCGKEVNTGAKFCSECGYRILQNAQAQNTEYQQSEEKAEQQTEYKQSDYRQSNQQQNVENQNFTYQQPPQQSMYQQPIYQQPRYQYTHSLYTNSQPFDPMLLVQKLIGKIKTEAIAWIIIASLQIIIGIYNLCVGIELNSSYWYTRDDSGNICIFLGLLILCVAAVNFFMSYKDFKYINEIKVKPVGIVKKYKPLGGLIAGLIYNVFFGGLIGAIVIIMGFLTRNFVVSNEQQFLSLECDYINQYS